MDYDNAFNAELISLAQEVIRREVEFERLFELIDTVQRGTLPEDVLGRVYDSFADLIPYDRIGCAFLSADGKHVTARWARSVLGPIRLGKGFSQPIAGSSLRTILESGEPRIINDLEAYLETKPDSLSTRRIMEEGGRSSLTCPLVAEQRAIGFLFFTSREKNAYRDLHPEIFRHIANQLSLVIEKSRMFERVHRAAHFDALTGLPNRAMFFETLEGKIAQAGPSDRLAVLYLDLDHFKRVNDTLGHHVGDRLLKDVARRLTRSVGARGTVARLGGDEFAVIQTPLRALSEAETLAGDIVRAINPPFRLEERFVDVGVSIGVAVASADMPAADELLKMADIALYEVKNRGRGSFCVFERRMDDQFRDRIDLERDLRRAVTAGELELFYQPILALDGAQIVACEALARWRHPAKGMISPAEFIPVAEETGIINDLGEWVLRTACAAASGWSDNIRIAVNVSARQLEAPGFVGIVRDALDAAGLDPARLEIELTESIFLHATEDNMAALREISAMGATFALDDFGTGFSSLSYLHRFRFSRLKIDRTFVGSLPGCTEATAIVRAVSQLARSLDMLVTAEGVETEEQLRHVRRLGCTEMQGYLLTPPRRASELGPFLRATAPQSSHELRALA